MCGVGEEGVALFKTEKYKPIARSCEEVFMESTWAVGSERQLILLGEYEEEAVVECRCVCLLLLATYSIPRKGLYRKAAPYYNVEQCSP